MRTFGRGLAHEDGEERMCTGSSGGNGMLVGIGDEGEEALEFDSACRDIREDVYKINAVERDRQELLVPKKHEMVVGGSGRWRWGKANEEGQTLGYGRKGWEGVGVWWIEWT
jgi:hypothetical protein